MMRVPVHLIDIDPDLLTTKADKGPIHVSRIIARGILVRDFPEKDAPIRVRCKGDRYVLLRDLVRLLVATTEGHADIPVRIESKKP